MREGAKFTAREPTYAILPCLPPVYTMAQNLGALQIIAALPRSHLHSAHYNSALFLDQPPPLWHKNTSISKNRRQACQSILASRRTTRGAGGRGGEGGEQVEG
ncbi:unnamed protein product [Pleuronectes platessa]|uniref:Uncharacterized protein n=1 Tax=Pleuronectes platessa TaxID=8262 RepID=A0A9N7Z8M0_PLEPL|nr:unnamed protein product [Pleuronectes platessa]